MNKPANISRERLRQLRKNAKGECFRSGCTRPHVKGGLCKTHYNKGKKAAGVRALASYYTRKAAR